MWFQVWFWTSPHHYLQQEPKDIEYIIPNNRKREKEKPLEINELKITGLLQITSWVVEVIYNETGIILASDMENTPHLINNIFSSM